MTLTSSRIDALIASAFNLHVGPVRKGDFMSPSDAAGLPVGRRADLCLVLAQNGGSDLYTKEHAREAFELLFALLPSADRVSLDFNCTPDAVRKQWRANAARCTAAITARKVPSCFTDAEYAAMAERLNAQAQRK